MEVSAQSLSSFTTAQQVLLAGRCELEAMLAENADRESKGLAQAYPASSFFELADRIRSEHMRHAEWIR